MKKFFLAILMMFITLGVSAQVYKYQSTSFAFKTKNSRGYWGNWSDWEKSSLLIVVNITKDVVDIYSSTPQHYDIVSYDGQESDGQGGTTFTFGCVDDDGSRCNIRTRKQNDGQFQLYVDYADACWVYNVYQKN